MKNSFTIKKFIIIHHNQMCVNMPFSARSSLLGWVVQSIYICCLCMPAKTNGDKERISTPWDVKWRRINNTRSKHKVRVLFFIIILQLLRRSFCLSLRKAFAVAFRRMKWDDLSHFLTFHLLSIFCFYGDCQSMAREVFSYYEALPSTSDAFRDSISSRNHYEFDMNLG